MRTLFFIVLVASSAACLRKTEYHCSGNDQCTGQAGGTCEGSTYCSFTDATCDSGRRYGEFAGELANQCVGDQNPLIDSGIDGRMIDAPQQSGCKAGYVAITGGGTHLYKAIGTAATWTTQRDACAADGTNVYLAIPNDVGELGGITTASGAALTWVGIDDITTEGAYVTVRGPAATYLPWDTGNNEPDNGGPAGGQDCVSALMTSPLIQTDACGASAQAVCECEP